jgi:hypothetical protein
MDKPKNKPAKMAPETGAHTEKKSEGFGWNTTSAYPDTIDGTNKMLRMGEPEDNTNAGNPGNSKFMQKKSKKAAGRKTRNIGRV